MTTVAITQNDDIGRAVDEAISHVDLEGIARGKVVAIKPNDTWASEDDTTAVTQPDTLRAVIRQVKRFAPKHIVVTGGAGAAETDDVLRVAGMMDVVDDEGVEFFDHNRPPFTEIDLAYAPQSDVQGPQKSVMVNPRVLEYDATVVVSQLKLHDTATVTMALKNLAMSFPAADYYGHPRSTERHENGFFADMASFIAAMARRFPIDLAITVGHPAMIGTGPIGGHCVETGLCIASQDALAADVVGARLLGFNLQGVHHLWEAAKLGVGESDTEAMRFPALALRDAIVAFTERAYGERLDFEHV